MASDCAALRRWRFHILPAVAMNEPRPIQSKMKMKKSISTRALALLAVAGAVRITAHAAPCNINMGANQQTMDGFGFSSAWCGQLSTAKNNALYNTLGFSLLRIRIDPNQNWNDETVNASAAHARGAKVLDRK